MVNQSKYGSTPGNNNAYNQETDMTLSRAADRRLILKGMFMGVVAIGLLGYGYKTINPPLAALLGHTGNGRHRFQEQGTSILNQLPPPLSSPVQKHCDVLDLLAPLFPDTWSEDGFSSHGLIYSADSLTPIDNTNQTFTVGPSIGTQFETVTLPFGMTFPSFSLFVNGMILLDPIVNANDVTSYDSSVSYNSYQWYTSDPSFTFISPPENPVTGGTGRFFGASGTYNSRFSDNIPFHYNVIGTDNKDGIFYLARLITCSICQAYSPKHPKSKSEKSRKSKS